MPHPADPDPAGDPPPDAGTPTTPGAPTSPDGTTAPPQPTASGADGLSVVVERSGGFAGLTRRWSVTAGPDDATWTALVDACDWDGDGTGRAASEPAGADRFCWTVTARTPAAERSAALAEHEVDGPWRALIDAVRSASEQ